MPRKKIIRKVVDKKDEFIEPKEALEMLGITINNETGVDTLVEEPVEEVPEVHVPQIYEATMYYKAGAFEQPEIVGYARYHELTNSLTL